MSGWAQRDAERLEDEREAVLLLEDRIRSLEVRLAARRRALCRMIGALAVALALLALVVVIGLVWSFAPEALS